jgi:hypothetical protein
MGSEKLDWTTEVRAGVIRTADQHQCPFYAVKADDVRIGTEPNEYA